MQSSNVYAQRDATIYSRRDTAVRASLIGLARMIALALAYHARLAHAGASSTPRSPATPSPACSRRLPSASTMAPG